MAYPIEYSPETMGHLRVLTSRQRAIVLEAVDKQLVHEPVRETRHRKPMRPNPLAPWELRIGDLRVYDDVQAKPRSVVRVLAVGIKQHNRVKIGKETIES